MCVPGRSIGRPCGSMTSRLPGKSSPWPESTSLRQMRYSLAPSCMLSRMRTARHDEAHLLRQLAAQRLDLVGDALALDVVDQRQQPVAQFDAQQVERQRIGDRLLGRLGRRRGLGFVGLERIFGLGLARIGDPGRAADERGKAHEDDRRHAGNDRRRSPSRRRPCPAPADRRRAGRSAPCRWRLRRRPWRPSGPPRSRRSGPASG